MPEALRRPLMRERRQLGSVLRVRLMHILHLLAYLHTWQRYLLLPWVAVNWDSVSRPLAIRLRPGIVAEGPLGHVKQVLSSPHLCCTLLCTMRGLQRRRYWNATMLEARADRLRREEAW